MAEPPDKVVTLLLAYWQGQPPNNATLHNNCRLLTKELQVGSSAPFPPTDREAARALLQLRTAQNSHARALLHYLIQATEPHEIKGERLREPPSLALTLRFSPQGAGYRVGWELDEFAPRTSTFEIPYTVGELNDIMVLLNMTQHMRPKASTIPSAQGVAHEVGRKLYDALTSDPSGASALQLARHTAANRGVALNYIFRIPPDSPQIAMLPWELLHDAHGPLLFGQREVAFCVRWLDMETPYSKHPEKKRSRPLHILTVTPSADIDEATRLAERVARESALSNLIRERQLVMETLEAPVSITHLNNRLNHGPEVDVIHFYGHGSNQGEGGLLFDESGWIETHRLVALLARTQVVVLHACHSSSVREGEVPIGIASSLCSVGVPAIVGMQLAIRADEATRFVQIFYECLAHNSSLEYAVACGRQTLYVEQGKEGGWYIPTLTIRRRSTEPLRLLG